MLFTCSGCRENYPIEENPTCCNTTECGWCHGDSCLEDSDEKLSTG